MLIVVDVAIRLKLNYASCLLEFVSGRRSRVEAELYDDEEVSESDGLSPGHSDDVKVVDARPVGARPAKSRPIALIQSISSKAPPKKMGKAYKGGVTFVKRVGAAGSEDDGMGVGLFEDRAIDSLKIELLGDKIRGESCGSPKDV
nr:hypothetical protein Iba_chr02bCG14490 [Ipomoea batatas]